MGQAARKDARIGQAGGTPERQRLARLMEFARIADFAALPARQQARWRKFIYSFPRGQVERSGLIEASYQDEATPQQASELLAWLKNEVLSRRGLPNYYFLDAKTFGRFGWYWSGTTLTPSGDIPAMFKLEALQLLATEGAHWLRTCASPGCKVGLFVAQKRAIFCSPRCAAREEARRFRAKQREKGKLKLEVNKRRESQTGSRRRRNIPAGVQRQEDRRAQNFPGMVDSVLSARQEGPPKQWLDEPEHREKNAPQKTRRSGDRKGGGAGD
jgi:hypothetical protein